MNRITKAIGAAGLIVAVASPATAGQVWSSVTADNVKLSLYQDSRHRCRLFFEPKGTTEQVVLTADLVDNNRLKTMLAFTGPDFKGFSGPGNGVKMVHIKFDGDIPPAALPVDDLDFGEFGKAFTADVSDDLLELMRSRYAMGLYTSSDFVDSNRLVRFGLSGSNLAIRLLHACALNGVELPEPVRLPDEGDEDND